MVLKSNLKENIDVEIIDLTPENIADYGVCGYKTKWILQLI